MDIRIIFRPPVHLPNIAIGDLIFPLRCAQRTLINDSESKGGGWGATREQFERAETQLSKTINQRTALPLGTLMAQLAHKLTTMTYAEHSLSH